jgi:AraC-like DNA-binding protein
MREERLQYAMQLLASSDSVKKVAFELGYSQESQFSRDFKARFGHQPSACVSSREEPCSK